MDCAKTKRNVWKHTSDVHCATRFYVRKLLRISIKVSNLAVHYESLTPLIVHNVESSQNIPFGSQQTSNTWRHILENIGKAKVSLKATVTLEPAWRPRGRGEGGLDYTSTLSLTLVLDGASG
jgi:hypothetical protein